MKLGIQGKTLAEDGHNQDEYNGKTKGRLDFP